MKQFKLLCAFIFCYSISNAQSHDSTLTFKVQKPKNTATNSISTEYPIRALDDYTEGTVIMQYQILTTGKIDNIRVLRGVSPEIDSTAYNTIKRLPPYPIQETVTNVVLPIQFKLSN